MKELDRVSEGVSKIGSCNTVVREGRSWAGYNTDAEGFINPLKEKLGPLKDLKTAVDRCRRSSPCGGLCPCP